MSAATTDEAPSVTVFDLPDRLAGKAVPAQIADDETHFALIEQTLNRSVTELDERLAVARASKGRHGQEALERDQEIHRVTARRRTLRRYGLDLCLGRIVRRSPTGRAEPVYIGRLGLRDGSGRELLIDWRSPAAEPFFAATHANPMGLASRRRYRWTRGRITDYWDEVFTPELLDGLDGVDGLDGTVTLDDQSAFIASLAGSRSDRMRDVLGTIQADQDAIIRAGSAGALVVDGGPGTGKTVVALHRAAYLLYADPRLGHRRGGLLFVGPHEPYLAYVSDVLPSLGEEGVRTCTLRELVAEGAAAGIEAHPEVARLKSSADMVRAIEPAVRFYEEPPTDSLTVCTPWTDLELDAGDWSEAFDAPEPGVPHNEAREQVLDALVTLLADRDRTAAPPGPLRESLRRNRDLNAAVNRAWPLIEAADLVGDLWTVPAYLRRCAPWLTADQVGLLQRPDPKAWTDADLPLLDAARRRLGDPDAARRNRRRESAVAARHAEMTQVVDHLIESDDSEMAVMSMLRGQDLRDALIDEDALPGGTERDVLGGSFAHIVVDEAQELTDAQWQMLLARCPSRSFTIVGDRAQARNGFAETWAERLDRNGFDRIDRAGLTINYRTPQEVMQHAEPVIRAVLPDANVPISVRRTGIPVRHGSTAELGALLRDWAAQHADGIACVIGDPGVHAVLQAGLPAGGPAGFPAGSRIRWSTPELAKGLEFDLVVLVDPERFGGADEGRGDRTVVGAVDLYVAMTRATQRLVILRSP